MKDKIENIWIDLNEELYRFVFAKVKDEAIAKDIVQEVFLKAQANIHKLKHSSKLTSWIYQITRNTTIDHFRNINMYKTPLNDLDFTQDEDQSFEYSALSQCINEKIENLSKEYKEAIILTYIKNYSQKQLAEIIELSYSGAKSRVQKARDILKQNILNCPNVESDNTGKLIDFQKE